MLHPITDYNSYKKQFSSKFSETLASNLRFRDFCYEVFLVGTAYIVGGYLRDVVLNKPSRDIDILIHLPNLEILKILKISNIEYNINRLNGIKADFGELQVDLWSIEHNWAFENKLVERNDDNILEGIANGCFYNYDSLVINLHTSNLNVRHFNEMAETNTLDIIQSNIRYKKLNPTIEANILRAFYLRKKFDLKFSANCEKYIRSRLGYLQDQFGSSFSRLSKYVVKYPKYADILTIPALKDYIKIYNSDPMQTSLDFH